jgi:hypothetical protein
MLFVLSLDIYERKLGGSTTNNEPENPATFLTCKEVCPRLREEMLRTLNTTKKLVDTETGVVQPDFIIGSTNIFWCDLG